MQKTKINTVVIGILLMVSGASYAQQEQAITSSQTVDALLNAENRSVYERERAPINKTTQKADFFVQSIYGTTDSMHADIKIGDKLVSKISIGDRVAGMEVSAIEGRCVTLYQASKAREKRNAEMKLASLGSDEEFTKKTYTGTPKNLCWTAPVAPMAVQMSPGVSQGLAPSPLPPSAVTLPR